MKFKRNKPNSKYTSQGQTARKKNALSKVPTYVIVITIILFTLLKLSEKGFIPLRQALIGTKGEAIYEKIIGATNEYERHISSFGKKSAEFIFNYLKSDNRTNNEEKVFAQKEVEEKPNGVQSDASSETTLKENDTFSPQMPCEGRISSPFGERLHPVSGQGNFHNGVDIAAALGTPIQAIDGGTVEKSTYDQFSGNFVVISHADGYTSSYLHLGESKVVAGQKVEKGEIIGSCGSTGISTGPHLHMEIKKDNTPVNPMELIED